MIRNWENDRVRLEKAEKEIDDLTDYLNRVNKNPWLQHDPRNLAATFELYHLNNKKN